MVNTRAGGETLGKQKLGEWLGCNRITLKKELDEDEIK
jgi:hypothetical protein